MEKNFKESRDSLTDRLRGGERSAAEQFVDEYYERIYLFMRGIGHSRQVSEDLTQETFLQAWYHISQLRDGKALNAWLYRIAGNVSRLYWRKNKGKELVSIEEVPMPENREVRSDEIVYIEELNRLKESVAGLPWKLRQTVVLHYMQHMTIAEAAEAAGVRQGTFKSRLNRALNILRKQFV